MERQYQYQSMLNRQGSQLQWDMWNKTNYAEQVRQLKLAGLSPSLMYGKGGGGGTTTGSQSGGSASGGSAPKAQPMNIGNLVEAMKAGMEMALLASEKAKKEAETEKLKAEVPKVQAETENITTRTQGQETENEILRESKADAINIIKQDSTIRQNQALLSEVNALFEYYVGGGTGDLYHTKDGSDAIVSEAEVQGSEKYKQYVAGRQKVQADARISGAEAELNEVLRKYGANNTTTNAVISILRLALQAK